MYGGNFVLTILRNGFPQKEIGCQVSLPFDTEYKIRLKNKNKRQALAKVFVDGSLVSGLGDFILAPNSMLDLERFLDKSLTEGNKFKFVSVDHPEVNDPTSSQNGIIKVEFRLEKQRPTIVYSGNVKLDKGPKIDWTYFHEVKGVTHSHNNDTRKAMSLDHGTDGTWGVNYCSAPCNYTMDGATIGGDISNQQFVYGSHFETESVSTVLTLRLISSPDLNRKETRVEAGHNKKYCHVCGSKVKRAHKFCHSCGSKLE